MNATGALPRGILWLNIYSVHEIKYADYEDIPIPGRIGIGVVTLFSSTGLLVVQILLVTTIRHRMGYESNFAFTLLLIMGVLDIVQLGMHITTAISLLSLQRSTQVFYIFGAVLEASWVSGTTTSCYLPVQRLVWVLFPVKASKILPVWFLKWVLYTIAVSFLFSLFLLITPYNGLTFMPERVSWLYMGMTRKHEHAWIYGTTEFILGKVCVLAPLAVGSVSNAIMIAAILRKGQKKIRDVRLTYHTIVYALFVMSNYYFLYYVDVRGIYWDLVSFFIRIFWNGINAILYFIFNRTACQQMKIILVTGGGREAILKEMREAQTTKHLTIMNSRSRRSNNIAPW